MRDSSSLCLVCHILLHPFDRVTGMKITNKVSAFQRRGRRGKGRRAEAFGGERKAKPGYRLERERRLREGKEARSEIGRENGEEAYSKAYVLKSIHAQKHMCSKAYMLKSMHEMK
eukprot:765992-Hanusia_phi.AAC.5